MLDVGCNDGFYTFECRKRGADFCLGIEIKEHHYKHAVLIKELLHVRNVEFRHASAYDIRPAWGNFDVSLVLGLIYHLKDPLFVLERISQITREYIILDSAIRNSDEDLARRKAGVPSTPSMDFCEPTSNWWLPNTECIISMLRVCGFPHYTVFHETILPSAKQLAPYGRAMIAAYRNPAAEGSG